MHSVHSHEYTHVKLQQYDKQTEVYVTFIMYV